MPISGEETKKEFTFLAIFIGLIVAIIMTAANVYLGLYAGMTVSASIPAAVIAAGVFRALAIKDGLYQSNIVQTMASAGESLAAGVIFTLPALIILGSWQEFRFWPTTLIAICGGMLGIIFMIPLRKALIIDNSDLIYPEGVACAKVLQAAGSEKVENSQGFLGILWGLSFGAFCKLLSGGLGLISASVEKAGLFNKRVLFFGFDMSPALIGVGYIVNLHVVSLVMIGGTIGWFLTIPLFVLDQGENIQSAIEHSWYLWSTKVRYMGVGAMLVGGLYSILSVRKGLGDGLKEIKHSISKKTSSDMTLLNQDMSFMQMSVVLMFCFSVMLWLYHSILNSFPLSFITAILMLLLSFPFVAVSSYIVGLVGSSNNPVSGITIAVLLATAAFFMVLGLKGDSAILATLGVASIVCCAACTSGDCSQDLKTGQIIQATPKYQQWAQSLGVIVPAFVIAPVLSLLHSAYGIGDGLKAPQATLFASITKALFGQGNIANDMIIYGVILGVLILIIDHLFFARRGKFRLHLMPIAVGIYLPISLAIPLFAGGLIRFFIEKKENKDTYKYNSDQGVLFSSGLIAGEALMGLLLALFISLKIKMDIFTFDTFYKESLSVMFFVLTTFLVFKFCVVNKDNRLK